MEEKKIYIFDLKTNKIIKEFYVASRWLSAPYPISHIEWVPKQDIVAYCQMIWPFGEWSYENIEVFSLSDNIGLTLISDLHSLEISSFSWR